MTQTVQVPVPRPVLDWLLDIGFTDSLTNEDEKKIDEWKDGQKRPTLSQISRVSKKLRVPFGYFFLKEPVDDVPPIYAHRTVASKGVGKPSRDFIDVLNSAQELQDWARQDLIDEGMEELTYVGSATADISPRTLTARIREELGLSETWSDFGLRRADTNDAFSRLRSAAQGAGMIVIMSGVVGENTHRPLSADEFRAFALIDDYAPLIFINRDDSAHGRLFSLAHEIAHVWLGEEELYNDDHDSRVTNKLERLCNAVAAELLLPKSQTERAWEQVRRNGVEIEAVLDDFVRRFPVSIVTVARRALDAGLISQKSYESHVQEAKDHWDSLKEEGKSPGGGNYYNTKQSRVDHRILERLIASVDEGRTSYTEALRLTGTNRRTFPNLLERVGL